MSRNTKPSNTDNAKSAPKAAKLDVAAAVAFGKSVGEEATKADVQAGNVWAAARTHYVAAQDSGQAKEWAAAFVKGCKSVKGRKAPWARNYMSVFTRLAALSIAITDKHGNRDCLKLLKAAKAAGTDDATKAKDAMKVACNFIQSAAKYGMGRGDILAAVREALDEAAE